MKFSFPKSPIAYFCAEYALDSNAMTYAGGLGILAGDFLLEAAKENFPFILISLHYGESDLKTRGYELFPETISIPIEKGQISVKAWIKNFGSSVFAILLDTGEKEILYDPHLYHKIRQELTLGLGGVAFLEKMGINPWIYHINEGHTSLASLGIIAREMKNRLKYDDAVSAARAKTVFTKHTIFAEAGIYISSRDFFDFIGPFCAKNSIISGKVFELGKYEKDEDMFSTTKFGVVMSSRRNAVSNHHLLKELYPSTDFTYVTNGIFQDRWRAPVDKSKNKKKMIDFIREKTGTLLSYDALTIVWARRLVSYKQPRLLFSDLERLGQILGDKNNPVQIIISGKAHIADDEGQKTMEIIRNITQEERFRGKVAYVPNYSLDIALMLTAGADLWLNTPITGYEACGTSGMKAGLNGSLMCSINDGWMGEVDWKDIGWILPLENTASALYDFLEKEIIPEFSKKTLWTARMGKTIAVIEEKFGADKMIKNYSEKMYGPKT